MTSRPEPPLAAVRIHPAFVVMGCFLATILGRETWVVRLDESLSVWAELLGTGLIAVGVLLLVVAYGTMARARTTIDPRQQTTSLVTKGVFSLSRNPIYLGWFALTTGIGVSSRSVSSLTFAFLMVGLLTWAVVVPEEAYLERVFGDEYRQYKARVRRWF